MSRAMALRELLPDVAAVPEDTVITGLVQDSRAIRPGDAFVAIGGFGTHGLHFTTAAREAPMAAPSLSARGSSTLSTRPVATALLGMPSYLAVSGSCTRVRPPGQNSRTRSSTAGGISATALMAVTPSLIPRDKLAAAGALMALTADLVSMIGPAIGGVVIAAGGVGVAYALAAFTTAITTFCITRLPSLPPTHVAEESPLKSVVSGFRYAAHNRVVGQVLIVGFLAMLLSGWAVLIPEFADEVLGVGPSVVGLLYTAPAVGAVIGSLTSGWTGSIRRYGLVVYLLMAVSAAGLASTAVLAVLNGTLAGDPGTPSVQTNIIYSNTKTLWVEPATGIIVKAQQDATQVLETRGGEQVLTLLDAVLTYDEATVDSNADDAARGANRLRLLGTILPLAALLLGLVAIGAGLVLLRSPEGRRVARGERRPADAV